jgi:hypothetical protein
MKVMEKTSTSKKSVTKSFSTKGVDGLAEAMPITNKYTHNPKMGVGGCTICDCPGFIAASSPGRTCINRNSAGGTCNHYESEHR